LPLVILLRNRLKYAITGREVTMILLQRFVRVDGKVRTDATYPAGFMDVVSIERTNEQFRLLYNQKGRFTLHRIKPEESQYKVCKVFVISHVICVIRYQVVRAQLGPNGVPFIGTHDGRTIRYPHPEIRVHDTVRVNLSTGKIEDHVKLAINNLVM